MLYIVNGFECVDLACLCLQHCDISQFLSEICECNVVLKKDFTQFTGSFKERYPLIP
jgi:hypothetical protein